MFQSRILASTLVALVSVPGYVLGQKLRHAEHTSALLLVPILMVIVFVASTLMRQSD
jgi:membrane protein DedA with SNARE-associated domain